MDNLSENRWVRRSRPWVRRLMVGYSLAQASFSLYNQGKQLYEEQLKYQVSVPASDPVYEDLHRWLLDNTEKKSMKSLSVRSNIRDRRDASTSVYYDGSMPQRLTIDGHRIAVRVISAELGESNNESPQDWISTKDRRKIVFTSPSAVGRDAVLDFIQERVQERAIKGSPPRLHVARSWGWDSAGEIPRRPLSSVILKKGQMEELCEDVEFFLGNQDAYARLGQPWHRGYLFQGPPGTGKSSLANALASHYGWDIFYLSLSDMKGDVDLINLVSSLPPKAMLLLEDVDVASAATKRDDEGKRSTLSGLLNALDGVATPSGLITVMTTNHPEKLDPALVRSGRIDREVTISNLSEDQILRMLVSAGVRVKTLPSHLMRGAKLSPAELSDLLKGHIGEADSKIIEAVRELIEEANSAAR